MPDTRSATVILDEEFLPIRAKLLEVAASLDRTDRAEGELGRSDPRLVQLKSAIEVLLEREGDRAEAIQLIFSQPYEEDWREKFRMTNEE